LPLLPLLLELVDVGLRVLAAPDAPGEGIFKAGHRRADDFAFARPTSSND
jgi:hypothetical protein